MGAENVDSLVAELLKLARNCSDQYRSGNIEALQDSLDHLKAQIDKARGEQLT